MSKIKIKNKEEKKTIIKLLNNYADSYQLLKDENMSLENEIKDLRLNIKINKEIISELLNSSNSKFNENKLKTIILKLNNENNLLYAQCEKISKEKLKLRNKLLKQDEINENRIEQLKLENEINLNKLFLYEQSIEEKNNIIHKLKLLIEKYKDGIIYEREVYITEPTKLICIINEELNLYKQIYSKLINSVQKIKSSKEKYANLTEKLQTENSKLRNKYLISVYSANREKETILTELSAISQNTKKNDNDDIRTINTTLTNYNKEKLKKKLDIIYFNSKNAFNDFDEILKACGLNMKIYREISEQKENEKFIEIIEMLFKIILDKNTQISLLEKEIANLTVKNFELNKSNMNLFVENNNLMNNRDSTLNSTLKKYNKDNSSIEGNPSKSINRNLILKNLDIYGRQIKKEEEENLNPKDSLSLQKDLDMIIDNNERPKTENLIVDIKSENNQNILKQYINTIQNHISNKKKDTSEEKEKSFFEEDEEEEDDIQSKYIEFENDNNEMMNSISNDKHKITKNYIDKENNDNFDFSCSTVKCDINVKKNNYLETYEDYSM